MAKKKVLTKVKTKVSTRTMLLIATGLIIVGGAAFGLFGNIFKNQSPICYKNVIINQTYNATAATSVWTTGVGYSTANSISGYDSLVQAQGHIDALINMGYPFRQCGTPPNPIYKLTVARPANGNNIQMSTFAASQLPPISCGVGSACSLDYNNGAYIFLHAAVAPGYTLASWSGCDGLNNDSETPGAKVCALKMDKDKTVSAVFASIATPTPTPAANLPDIAFYNPSEANNKYGNIIVSLRGGIAYLEVVMLNMGSFPMSQVSAQLKIDAYINGQYMQSAYLHKVDWLSGDSVSSNARAEFTSALNLANYKGQTITLKLVADPDNVIQESNESNNTIEAKVAIPSVFNVVFMEPLS